MKEKFRDLLGGFILAILLFLSAGLFLHVFIEPIYLEQGKSSSLTQDIQNIISFLSFCATAAIGWLAYEIQKKQKKFNENQAELENTRAKRQLEFNEKSLTDYQRDFLRKSFREFCFYNELISKIELQISSLNQDQRHDYDARFCLASRVSQWIAKGIDGHCLDGYSFFENFSAAYDLIQSKSAQAGRLYPSSDHKRAAIIDRLKKIIESVAYQYNFSMSGANFYIFCILHDKIIEIEVMGFEEIANLWQRYILEKFEFTERQIFFKIRDNSRDSKSDVEYVKHIANLVQKEFINNAICMSEDREAVGKVKEMYQKYLTNNHIGVAD